MIRKIFNVLLFICLSFVFMPPPVHAIVGVPDDLTWVPAGFGGAGTYSIVVPDHFIPNKVYSIPDVNAPYVSENKGELWNFLTYHSAEYSNYAISQTGSFAQSRVDGNLLFAMDSSSNGLMKSVDAGQKWTKSASFKATKGQKFIVTDPTDVNKVYATTVVNGSLQGGAVYQSVNQGTSFNFLFRPFDVPLTNEVAELTAVAPTSSNPNPNPNQRTGTLNNLSNPVKGSITFTTLSEDFTDTPNATGAGGVLTGTQGGTGTINYITGAYSIIFADTPPTSASVNYTVAPNPSVIAIDSTGQYLYAGRNAASGKTFVQYNIATGVITPITLAGTNAAYVLDSASYIDENNVENLCFTAGYRIACTPDNAQTWNYTANMPGAATTSYINHFAVRRNTDNTLNFVINKATISNSAQTTPYYSHNGGTTWSVASFATTIADNPTDLFASGGIGRTYCISADPFNENVWYASSDWRMYRSDDGGAHFVEKVKGAQNTVTTDLAIAPNGRRFQTAMDTGIQYSDDLGQTWIQAVPNATQKYVTFSTNDYGGHYWRILTLGTKEEWDAGHGIVIATATMYSTPASIYFVNFVVRSEDNGATWSRTNVGLPTAALFGDVIWDRGYMRALAKSKDESVLYVGVDGENCKVNQSLPSDNCASSGTNHTLGGLFMSTDKGKTWTQVWSSPRKIYNAIAVDPTDPTGQKLMFGTFSYNLYQRISGSTPNFVGDSFGPGNFIYDVAYDSKGRPYATASNSGPKLYRSETTSYSTQANPYGGYGTFRLVHAFGTGSGILDGIYIDPANDSHIFVSVTLGTTAFRKIWVTTTAHNGANSVWYDITGDFPVVGGCQALTVDWNEGPQGTLYCSSNGGGIWKLNLADSVEVLDGVTSIGE